MRGRGVYHLKVNQQLKIRLAHLKELLAESGYKIFPVSEPMRRSSEDFIAATSHKARVSSIIVRPMKGGKIELRCFEAPELFRNLRSYLRANERRYESIRPIKMAAQLPFGDKTLGWAQYVDPKYHKELKLFFGPEITEPQR